MNQIRIFILVIVIGLLTSCAHTARTSPEPISIFGPLDIYSGDFSYTGDVPERMSDSLMLAKTLLGGYLIGTAPYPTSLSFAKDDSAGLYYLALGTESNWRLFLRPITVRVASCEYIEFELEEINSAEGTTFKSILKPKSGSRN